MVLNEYLEYAMGVWFEGMYNALAVAEILENKEKYPLIYKYIKENVEDYENAEEEWNYDCYCFSCDDPDLPINEYEVTEHYHAFVSAFANDMKDKPIKVDSASFGMDYNGHSCADVLYNQYRPCHGFVYVSIYENVTELGKTVKRHGSLDEYIRSYSCDNEELLKKIGEDFRDCCRNNCLLSNCLDNDALAQREVKMRDGRIAYPCDCYEIRIGKNYLKIYTTERGFDALSLLRSDILENLPTEEQEHQIVKEIQSFGQEQVVLP